MEHKYKLGDKYRPDFDIDGMLEAGRSVSVKTPVSDLRLLHVSFQDMNYHTASKPLWDAIKAFEIGDKEAAEKNITEFKKKVEEEIDGTASDIDLVMQIAYDAIRDALLKKPNNLILSDEYGVSDGGTVIYMPRLLPVNDDSKNLKQLSIYYFDAREKPVGSIFLDVEKNEFTFDFSFWSANGKGTYKDGGEIDDDILKNILHIFKKNTKYKSETYPTDRYCFTIDTPSANTVYFRTKYFGNWTDNIQVSYSYGDDFFRISKGDNRYKTTDLNELDILIKELHTTKTIKYKNYLTNEYSTDSDIHNIMVDIDKKYADGGEIDYDFGKSGIVEVKPHHSSREEVDELIDWLDSNSWKYERTETNTSRQRQEQKYIQIDTKNVSREERAELKEYLSNNSWDYSNLYADGGMIAKTIASQLGGTGRLSAMTGAYNFIDTGKGLSFRIKNARANYIKITLNSMDLYDVEIGRIRGSNYTIVKEGNGLYSDMLKQFIERGTGMYLSMEKGGIVQFVKEEDRYSKGWGRKGERDGMECVGAFDIKGWKGDYGYLWELSEFDKGYWKDVPLKQNEMLFRYESDATKIGKMMPVVKINLEKGLIYFLNDLYADDDKNLDFSTKGMKPLFISFHTKVYDALAKQSNYKMTENFADGGQVGESLEKELRKLQRDLNSRRLSTYMEGDNSEEALALKKEREIKLARFNEVLKLLRESENKMAKGGTVRSSSQIKKLFADAANLVDAKTDAEVITLWNQNAFSVLNGFTEPLDIQDYNNNMRTYLSNMLVENQLSEAEYNVYFENGGLVRNKKATFSEKKIADKINRRQKRK